MRMCVGCGEMKPKKELIRIVTDSEGNTCVDLTGKKAGKSKRIKVSDEIIAELEAVLADEQ